MRVRLTRKLAEKIDGVDISAHQVGDVFNLSRGEARLLIAEGWASPIERTRSPDASGLPPPTRRRPSNPDLTKPAVAADSDLPKRFSRSPGSPKPRRTHE
jgi:hypothetical protein